MGGHCIAVDPWFIVDTTPDEAKIIRTAREVNDFKPEWVLNQVKAGIVDAMKSNPGMQISDITVACLGLAFKADIDDLRESPAVSIVKKICQLGCKVLAVEPNIEDLPSNLDFANLELAALDDALNQANVVCVLVKHRSFIEEASHIGSISQIIDAVGLLG